MFNFVYILRSMEDNKFCIGFTADLRKRLTEHNNGKNPSTKLRRPFELIYYEAYRNKKDAKKRELFFKSGWGRQFMKKNIRNFLNEKFRRVEQ